MAIANAPAASGRTTLGGPQRDSRPLVLVVDDEESYRQALASGLTAGGFHGRERRATATRRFVSSTGFIPISYCST